MASLATAQLELKTESRLRIEAPAGFDAYTWQVPSALVYEQQGNLILVDGPGGKYRVHVSALSIDWDAKQFKQETGYIDIELGTPAPPEPVPLPDDVPDDEFGNIGQRASAWAIELKLQDTRRVANNYAEAAARLLGEQEPLLLTIDAAEEWIGEANGDLGGNWPKWGAKINDDYREARVDRATVGRFYKAIAAGLKVVE